VVDAGNPALYRKQIWEVAQNDNSPGKQLQEINIGEATTFGLIHTSYNQADLSGQM
jgi:hypothetical protein